jgi:PAS domain S-box-containing protein
MELPLRSRATAPRHSTWFSVLVGILGIVFPTLGRLALDPLLGDQAPYLLHLAAVPVATWLAGAVAGGIALAGGTLAVQILFLAPGNDSLPVSLPIAAGEALFVVVGGAAVWLIGQLGRKDRALRHQRERLQRLVDASAQIVWLANADGLPVEDSPSWRAFTGRSFEQYVGWTWLDAVHPDDRERLASEWRDAVKNRRPFQPEFRLLHHSGEYRHIVCSSVPIMAPDGSVREWIGMNLDVTQQKRALEELRELSQRLTYHVNYSPLAVIEWGPDMRLTRWSGEAERLFGWTAEEVLGKRMDEFRWVFDEDTKHVQQVSTDLGAGAQQQRFSLNRNYRKDGAVVWCEWYNSSLLDESGRYRSILSLVLDVTARRRLEEQLRATAAELAQANRLKDEFLATLSHELRTPLHAIVGWSAMLLSDRLPPERHRHGIEVIARNARVQSQLIEEVLDMSRIVTGKLRLSLEAVSVANVVLNAIESMRPAADVKGVTIESDLHNVPLVADGARLQQVVWNLVSNAVKFTPAGGRVSVSTRRAADHVDIVVHDNGIGISSEFLPSVFDRFSQADASSTRQQGGLGLGLAIVLHLTEMHGGTVWASSAGTGQGATFVVRIPVRQPSVASPMFLGTSDGRGDSELAGIRVLVIEDDHDTREVVGETLRTAGALVSLAKDGVEAEAALPNGPFDVVLSDIAMPGEDGFEVLERLRRALAPSRMPTAIAFTGYGHAVDRHRALQAGFREHLVKPVPPEVLVACVKRASDDTRAAARGVRDGA